MFRLSQSEQRFFRPLSLGWKTWFPKIGKVNWSDRYASIIGSTEWVCENFDRQLRTVKFEHEHEVRTWYSEKIWRERRKVCITEGSNSISSLLQQNKLACPLLPVHLRSPRKKPSSIAPVCLLWPQSGYGVAWHEQNAVWAGVFAEWAPGVSREKKGGLAEDVGPWLLRENIASKRQLILTMVNAIYIALNRYLRFHLAIVFLFYNPKWWKNKVHLKIATKFPSTWKCIALKF